MKKNKYSFKETSRGLKILNFYDPSTKRVGIEFLTKASTSINPRGKSGLAHFAEHLLARQSKNFPTQLKQAIALEELGAHFGAFTGHFETGYNVSGGVQDFKRLLYILSDTVINPHINSESISSEKSIIEKEIVRMRANDSSLGFNNMCNILYKNSSLEYSNLGKLLELNKLSKVDVLDFKNNNYLTSNSLVAVWGGMKDKDVFKTVEASFNGLRNTEWNDPEFEFSRSKYKIVANKDTPQVSLNLSFRLPKDHKMFHVLKVARMILCSGWTSRIPARLRVKESLIYTWESNSSVLHDNAKLSINLSTSNRNYKKMFEILAEEIVKFRENNVKKSELELAKKRIIKPFAWDMERAGNLASWYIDQYFFEDSIETPEDYIKSIEKITKKDVAEFAQKYLTSDNWYMSVVGNVKEELKFEI